MISEAVGNNVDFTIKKNATKSIHNNNKGNSPYISAVTLKPEKMVAWGNSR